MTEQQAKSLREILAYTAPEQLAWKIGMLVGDAVEAELRRTVASLRGIAAFSVADEREACAKIADDENNHDPNDESNGVAVKIAAAIRAR